MRLLLILLFFNPAKCFAQVKKGELVYSIPKPDVKWGLASDVLISPDNKYVLISYDYNPSYVDLFEIEGFKKLKQFKIRGHTYLFNSFFHDNNSKIYIDIGKRINIGKEKIQYMVFDINSNEVKRIKCEEGPKGCNYAIGSPYVNLMLKEYTTTDRSLLFAIEKNSVNVYKIAQ